MEGKENDFKNRIRVNGIRYFGDNPGDQEELLLKMELQNLEKRKNMGMGDRYTGRGRGAD